MAGNEQSLIHYLIESWPRYVVTHDVARPQQIRKNYSYLLSADRIKQSITFDVSWTFVENIYRQCSYAYLLCV